MKFFNFFKILKIFNSFRFNKFRISKSALLARYTWIDISGNVKSQRANEYLQAGLMISRYGNVVRSYCSLFKALIISTRYSIITRLKTTKNGRKIRLYDLQTQREVLFNALAQAYCMASINETLRQLIHENYHRCLKSDTYLLRRAYLVMCGVEAEFTVWSIKGISALMQACGHKGQSEFSGLPHLLQQCYMGPLSEGKNSFLLLEISRELIQAYQDYQIRRISRLPRDFRYLKKSEHLERYEFPETREALLNCKLLLRVFEKVCCFITKNVSNAIYEKVSNGVNPRSVSIGGQKRVRKKVFSFFTTFVSNQRKREIGFF